MTWYIEKNEFLGQSDNTAGRILVLHTANLGSITGTTYDSPKIYQEWFQSTDPGVSPEHYHIWLPLQKTMQILFMSSSFRWAFLLLDLFRIS